MPLKQGTEIRRSWVDVETRWQDKKDAPKAGDGNFLLVSNMDTPFHKKDAPKAGDGNSIFCATTTDGTAYKKDAPKAGDGNFLLVSNMDTPFHKKDAPKAGDGNL